jgi:peptidoglycan/xylan/chitin deacetylase (PgdA/CDA1 family)
MTVVSLTFDDGYLAHYETAKKLYRMDIQATFFIITGLKMYVGRKLLTMRSELIKEIIDMGHEIGSHTDTHRDLTALKLQEVENEVTRSLTFVSRFVEGPVGFAYPYGSFNKDIVDIVRRYHIYARTMGHYNKWNKIKDKFCLGGMGARHLPEIVLRALFDRETRLAVLVFHEDVRLAITVAKILKNLGFEIKPLKEALKIYEKSDFNPAPYTIPRRQ